MRRRSVLRLGLAGIVLVGASGCTTRAQQREEARNRAQIEMGTKNSVEILKREGYGGTIGQDAARAREQAATRR